MASAVDTLLGSYPKIFLACHARHVRDPKTGDQLSARQASILDHLDEVDPLTLNELARHLGVTLGTMSLAVERLVRGGYVHRDRDEVDRRKLTLRLTAKGARVRDAQTVLDPKLVRHLLDQLSPAQRARALEGLTLLSDAAQKLMHARHDEKRHKGAPR